MNTGSPAQVKRVVEALAADGVRDRAGAVWWLAAHPARGELTSDQVLAVLDHYPAMAWDSATSQACLRLLEETTAGGLAALLAAMPEQHVVSDLRVEQGDGDQPTSSSRRLWSPVRNVEGGGGR